MKSYLQIGTLILLLVSSIQTFASNFSFFGNSAISFYTNEDWKLSKSAQLKALDQIKDGVRLAWTNPETGSHGAFIPTHTFHAKGSVCRDMQILHTANRVNDKAIYRFCKMNNGWKIV